MNVEFHPDAKSELDEYARSYEDEIEGLGIRFIEEAERLSGLLREHPQLGQAIEGEFRHLVFVSFPHSYIYRIDSNRIWILAVAHHKRRPGYWNDRSAR